MNDDKIDLFRYHDLTSRLAVYLRAGGEHLEGDTEDIEIIDAEPAMIEGEAEQARVAGVLKVIGPRSTIGDDEPSTGLVLEGMSTILVTNRRLIISVLNGASQLGGIDDDVVHMMAFPWDLIDVIEMPKKKRITDRIAGARSILLTCLSTFTYFDLNPAKTSQIDGREQRVTDLEVFHLLTDIAADARRAVTPPAEHARLNALKTHKFPLDDGVWCAYITDADDEGTPIHLEGRLVERE